MRKAPGDPLDPYFLCQTSRAAGRLQPYLEALITDAKAHGSVFTAGIKIPDLKAFPSAANHTDKKQNVTHMRQWTTCAKEMEEHRVHGSEMLFNSQSLVDALLQIKATAKENDFDVGLNDYDSKRFNRKTGHPLHVGKSDRCKLLAHARVQLFGEMKRDPTAWGQQIGWTVPPRPPSTNTYAIRDRNGEVLQGHTANNVNPDHQHVLFRSYLEHLF